MNDTDFYLVFATPYLTFPLPHNNGSSKEKISVKKKKFRKNTYIGIMQKSCSQDLEMYPEK